MTIHKKCTPLARRDRVKRYLAHGIMTVTTAVVAGPHAAPLIAAAMASGPLVSVGNPAIDIQAMPDAVSVPGSISATSNASVIESSGSTSASSASSTGSTGVQLPQSHQVPPPPPAQPLPLQGQAPPAMPVVVQSGSAAGAMTTGAESLQQTSAFDSTSAQAGSIDSAMGSAQNPTTMNGGGCGSNGVPPTGARIPVVQAGPAAPPLPPQNPTAGNPIHPVPVVMEFQHAANPSAQAQTPQYQAVESNGQEGLASSYVSSSQAGSVAGSQAESVPAGPVPAGPVPAVTVGSASAVQPGVVAVAVPNSNGVPNSVGSIRVHFTHSTNSGEGSVEGASTQGMIADPVSSPRSVANDMVCEAVGTKRAKSRRSRVGSSRHSHSVHSHHSKHCHSKAHTSTSAKSNSSCHSHSHSNSASCSCSASSRSRQSTKKIKSGHIQVQTEEADSGALGAEEPTQSSCRCDCSSHNSKSYVDILADKYVKSQNNKHKNKGKKKDKRVVFVIKKTPPKKAPRKKKPTIIILNDKEERQHHREEEVVEHYHYHYKAGMHPFILEHENTERQR